MWYIYLLIGLYLYMPFFSAWIDKADRKMKQTYTLDRVFSLFLPYMGEYISHYLYGTATWNEFGTLYYFAGFNGYLLLGHYVKQGNSWSVGKTLLLSLSYLQPAIPSLLPVLVQQPIIRQLPNRIWNYFSLFGSPNVLCMTLAVFLALQKVVVSTPALIRSLANITKCGFGIYMVHYFLVGPAFLLIGNFNLPIPLQVPVMAILIFLCAWGFTALMYRLLGRKARWIMG